MGEGGGGNKNIFQTLKPCAHRTLKSSNVKFMRGRDLSPPPSRIGPAFGTPSNCTCCCKMTTSLLVNRLILRLAWWLGVYMVVVIWLGVCL